MYKSIVFTVLFFCFTAFSQKDDAKDVVNINKKEVKQTILTFFEGFHAGDTSKIKKTIDPNMVMHTIVTTKEGKKRMVKTDVEKFLNAINDRPVNQRWDERLLLFKIDADSAIANVWTPYEFYLNDTFSHCGVNVFQLFNDGSSWKIMALADTRNRAGCK